MNLGIKFAVCVYVWPHLSLWAQIATVVLIFADLLVPYLSVPIKWSGHERVG